MATPVDELERMLATAIAAARLAGAHMTSQLGQDVVLDTQQEKWNPNDLVTAVDQKCQALVFEHLAQAFPTHAFLGEEDVAPGSQASVRALDRALDRHDRSSYIWIVDPIDGTTNFVHRRPASVVSVACARVCDAQVIVGVVLDPYRDECFTATAGGGACVNGQRLARAPETALAQALVGFGIGTKPAVREPMLRFVDGISRACRGIRLQGSAALELAWVASGRQTAFFELDLNSWDLAAGALLIMEAGGKCTDSSGQDFTLRTRHIVASNGQGDIHSTLLETIKRADAVTPSSA